MNILTRHSLICSAIAALGLLGGAVWGQNAPATAPETAPPATTGQPATTEQPAATGQPTTTEQPAATGQRATTGQPTTPAAQADATPPADTPADTGANDTGPRPADDISDADPPIVWTRDRARGRNGFRGNGDELVTVGGNSTLGANRRSDSVVSVFGSSTSSGNVRDSVVSVFGNTRVEDGRVGDSAVSVVGNTYVNAEVGDTVVAVLGDVELGPKARIQHDVVVIGGQLIRDPAARVEGDVQHVMTFPHDALAGMKSWLQNCLRYLRPLAFEPGLGWVWTIAIGFLALYALLAVLFRDPLDRCVRTLQERPGETIIASLLTVLLTPVLYVILAFTIIGVPLIPVVGFGMFLATLFGKAVVLAWIGRGVLKVANQDERTHSAIAVLIGGVIVLLLYVVPVLGFLVFNLLGILGLGTVIYTFLLASRARRGSSPPPSGGARAPGVGPTPAAAAGGTALSPGSDVPPAGATPYTAGFNTAGFSAERMPGDAGGAAAAETDAASTSSASGAADSGGFEAPGPGGEGAGAATPPPTNGVADALSLPRAGFWIRMLALLIDAVIVGVVFSALDHHARLQIIALAAYGAIMWKLKGTTIGGIVCNLKIVRIDGREVDWSTAIVRALGCFLSLIVVGLGFIWIAFDPGRQAWHDKIAGTAVVRVPQGVSLL